MTSTKTTQRELKAIECNKEHLASTKAKIESMTSNENNIVNVKARETMQALIESKDMNNEHFVASAYSLCTILVQSKLKALNSNERTYNDTNVKLKTNVSVIMDNNGTNTKIDTYLKELASLYYEEYNHNGELETKCKDKKQALIIERKITELNNHNDGLELVHVAIVELMEHVHKALGNDTFTDSALLDTFEVLVNSSTMYRNGEIKPCTLWKYTTTNAIKEVSKAISRHIENMRSVKDTSVCYESIESEVYDERTDEYITVTRYNKVNAIEIDAIKDYNGKVNTMTSNSETRNLVKDIIEKANFTRNQSYIFRHHFLNYESTLQIADKLKVSERYIENEISKIKDKCVASGVFASYGYTKEDKVKTTNKERATRVKCVDVASNKELYTFDSLGSASKALNIDKSNISKVLKGKRKSVQGFTFEYVK